MCLSRLPLRSDPDRARAPVAERTAAATDAYLESKLVHPGVLAGDPLVEKWYGRARAAGLPDIRVSAMQGQYLSVLARALRAAKILEIGTLWG